ncbi:ATP-binding protein [Paenibacillus sp. ACRRX]|uniref:two-component system sensor histidine kinase NtrB n=1 Tax=unclassified Paenibacillus TaxID=185978 RepID=UPI001EF4CFD1|nr:MULTISPECIES: ATP-binding protein [unclassified Paenibacillus]MCG7408553.1 ATP-binding protein [Paenibacillus sp. ACRRX]MDK8182801.1 ATP-binding protein [Paenibacillus sp. UMB4589-SE434]
MFVALKETVLQVFIAYIPAFSCQLYTMKPERISKAHINIGVFSSISVLLCMMLSFYYFSETAQPFDFRLIPYMLGILYGGYRIGALVSALYFFMLLGFPEAYFSHALWSDALVYLTPFLFMYVNKFRHSSARHRMMIVMNFALLGMALYLIHYVYVLWDSRIKLEMDVFLFMAMFGAVFLLAACTVVHFIESTREKAYLQQSYLSIWRQYRQEAQKLHQVIDATPLGVIAVDANARITAVNQSLLHTLRQINPHYDASNIIGQEYGKYFADNQFWETDNLLVYRVLCGESMQSEMLTVGERTYLTRASSMRNQETGEIVGAVGMMHDITELVQLRAEMGNMERLSLVGQMAASITHEIRNPMAVVRGFIQLMKQKSPGHLEDYYTIVMEELDRANSIINDFLSLAQNRIVEKESIYLHELIMNISPLLWADANLRGQEIQLELAEELPPLLLNPKEMKQLLLNLARNGMEAMTDKGILTIVTRYCNGHIELLVQDTGTGIPKAVVDKLFEPFYTTKAKGTGLGLPLCLSIVERHEGVIRVETKEGAGTTFIVAFKAEANEQDIITSAAV